jgi:hypothetical protein
MEFVVVPRMSIVSGPEDGARKVTELLINGDRLGVGMEREGNKRRRRNGWKEMEKREGETRQGVRKEGVSAFLL